jgi:SAM-dependent methyltransferase
MSLGQDVQPRAPACIVCSARMTEHYSKMFDNRYGYPGYFSIFRCPECEQMQTEPLLSDADLPTLYSKYYPRREIDCEALVRYVRDPGARRERNRRWLSGTDNQGQYSARRGMAVLDYGCGTGQSLLELEKLGAEAYGLEADPNVRQVVDTLNLRIHIGTLDDNPFPGVFFDLIVLNQVLEHIPQPHHMLAKLRARLRPGGRIALSFPNSASVYRRQFGRDWINWHVPYHLHHFNPRSARLFFERHGWRVLSMRTITPNLWTVLQLRAAEERSDMGVANALWTGQRVLQEDGLEKRTPSSSRSMRALYSLAQRANGRGMQAVVTAFNRACDALGLGDSILVTIAETHPA